MLLKETAYARFIEWMQLKKRRKNRRKGNRLFEMENGKIILCDELTKLLINEEEDLNIGSRRYKLTSLSLSFSLTGKPFVKVS